jgi:hypothetical protein
MEMQNVVLLYLTLSFYPLYSISLRTLANACYSPPRAQGRPLPVSYYKVLNTRLTRAPSYPLRLSSLLIHTAQLPARRRAVYSDAAREADCDYALLSPTWLRSSVDLHSSLHAAIGLYPEPCCASGP